MSGSPLLSGLGRLLVRGVRFLPAPLRWLLQWMLPLSLFVLIDQLAVVLTPLLHLPLPSSLSGMVLLVALLGSGLVKEAWLAQTADLLQRHLALFFVPFAVGLMAYGALLRSQGLALLLVIASSTVIGVVVVAWVASLPGAAIPDDHHS